MSHHNEGELKMVIQALLGLFIAYSLTRFLYQIGVNYNLIASVIAFVGLAFLYFCFRSNKEFDTFVIILCVMAFPFSVMFAILS